MIKYVHTRTHARATHQQRKWACGVWGFRAVDVTPRMAAAVIAELAKLGVRSIVAPYEADCQMAFLALHGHVHAVRPLVGSKQPPTVYHC